jgi:hypothetical protein
LVCAGVHPAVRGVWHVLHGHDQIQLFAGTSPKPESRNTKPGGQSYPGKPIFLEFDGKENYYINALMLLIRTNCVVIFLAIKLKKNRFPRINMVNPDLLRNPCPLSESWHTWLESNKEEEEKRVGLDFPRVGSGRNPTKIRRCVSSYGWGMQRQDILSSISCIR